MNDKDKEAFKVWGADQDGDKPLLEGSAYEAWQAACEYKQKEIDKDKILILELSVENAYYFNLIAKLQAENAKLRECVEFYADYKNDNPDHDWNNDLARQVLKELENK